jgi:hypothetical protein
MHIEKHTRPQAPRVGRGDFERHYRDSAISDGTAILTAPAAGLSGDLLTTALSGGLFLT